MKRLASLIIILPSIAFAAPLWPLPKQYALGDRVLWFAGARLHVTCNVLDNAPIYPPSTDTYIHSAAVLRKAIERTVSQLLSTSFTPWKFHPRNTDWEPPLNATPSYIRTLTVTQTGSDPGSFPKLRAGDIDESYGITVSEGGDIVVTGISTHGLLHGLNTLTQLFYKHSNGQVYTPYAPVAIEDVPKLKHRGLSLDVARSFYHPNEILHVIDAMAMNKLNRLHLHMTDAQSWPLEIPALPELVSKGAYAPGLSYNPACLGKMQEYAAYLGIEMIIEIDMPGHTSSIAFSHPELITGSNIQPNWQDYSAQPGSGQLKLNETAVEAFLASLWEDLLPRVSPFTSYFHTGGDEINVNPYKLQEGLRTNDTKILQPLLQKFIDFNHDRIRGAGLTPIVWEEMLVQWNLTLGRDVLVQTWGSTPSALAQTVEKGYKAIASDYNYWYLDCGKGQWIDAIPSSPSAPPFPYTDYCTPTKNWRTIYSYDPLASVPANLTHLVLGGEVALWSEQTDPANIDGMLWPRAAAAAEVLWSGAKDAEGKNRSQVEASPRLAEWRERLLERGIRAAPIQPAWCTQNGTQCAL